MTRLPVVIASGLLLTSAWLLPLEAHKPITSPFTFAEDVAPILRERCAACHTAGGPAPMPLTTAEETVPWGESIRLELVSGHMPPWSAMSNGNRLPHAEGLTARELNVLLTWVTGGTPPGDAKPAPPATPAADWPLGTPDLTLPLPAVTIAADQGEMTREFVVALDAASRRPIRAVDLKPGTRSLVRSAQIVLKTAAQDAGERLLALWVPGDVPAALPAGATFHVHADAELVIRVRYKKTWQLERDAMSDRSEVGLYFTQPGSEVTRMPLNGTPFDQELRLLSVHPSPETFGRRLTLDAVLPDGETRRLIDFTPRPGWERRYAFTPPLDLPRGTRLVASEPGALVLNVVPVPIYN
jgi:hypothetical protein